MKNAPSAPPSSGRPGAASSRIRRLLAAHGSPAASIDHADPPRAMSWTLGALLAMLLGFAAWAGLSSMDIVTTARGRLVSVAPNLVIQPLETGILRSIEVRVGQAVRQGDVLARLDPTFVGADAGQVSSRTAALTAQLARLESELAGASKAPAATPADPDQARLRAERRAAYEARLRQLDEAIGRQTAALVSNRSDQAVLATRLKALKELEEMNDSLAEQQFVSKNRVLESKERRLEVERDYNLARLKEQEIQRELGVTREERAAFTTDWRSRTMEELTKVRQELTEIKEQGVKAARRTDLLTLRSPADAVVLEIAPRSTGSVVREAEPVLTLVASNSPLEVEAEIAPADVGFLRPGQKARIKFDAYPFQKHGTLDATLLSVSRDSVVKPNATDERRHFVGRLRLESGQLDLTDTAQPLSPGMALTAEIVTGQRTVASYLTYPVIRARDESMRER